MLVKGALDGGLVIASLEGIYHAIDDGSTTPLIGLQSVSFSTFERRPDGTFRHRLAEAEYYTDLASGAIIYAWSNPLTGRKITLADRCRNVSEFLIHSDLSVTLGSSAAFRQSVTSTRRDGDDLWYEEQLVYSPRATDVGLPSTEFVTYHARQSDVARQDAMRVPAQVYYTVVSGWRPWMDMGGRPGSVVLRGRGQAKITHDLLPRQWVERTLAYWPQLINSPLRVLARQSL